MTVRRVTTYICDGCGKEVDGKKSLRRFTIQLRRDSWYDASTDLCIACEQRFLNLAAEFFPGKAGEELDDMRREAP